MLELFQKVKVKLFSERVIGVQCSIVNVVYLRLCDVNYMFELVEVIYQLYHHQALPVDAIQSKSLAQIQLEKIEQQLDSIWVSECILLHPKSKNIEKLIEVKNFSFWKGLKMI